MTGWIAISRDLFSHGFFAREPMSEREAWIWMIARAAWKETRHRIGGDVVDVPRGAFFCTLRELQQAWGWGSDKRVRTFIKRLQNERMVDASATAGKTQISICNYEQYQDIGRNGDASETENGRSADALKEQVNNKQETRMEEPSGSSKARGSRLPPDWRLPLAWGEWAVAEGMTEAEARRTADIFRDYWLAAPSAKGVKANWELTWRNWVRKSLADRRNGPKSATPQRRKTPDGRWQSFDPFNGWMTEHA